jgi:hypothetical protein
VLCASRCREGSRAMSFTAPLTTPSPVAKALCITSFTLANVLVAWTPAYRIRLQPLGLVCCIMRPRNVSTSTVSRSIRSVRGE